MAAINRAKIHRMSRAAEYWVVSNDYDGPYELMAAEINSIGEIILVNLYDSGSY